MTPQQAESLWWAEMANPAWADTTGKPDVQRTLRLRAWDVLLTAIRKDYELELERLRQENRDLKHVITESMTTQATFVHPKAA